jgi:hypothetical protein
MSYENVEELLLAKFGKFIRLPKGIQNNSYGNQMVEYRAPQTIIHACTSNSLSYVRLGS